MHEWSHVGSQWHCMVGQAWQSPQGGGWWFASVCSWYTAYKVHVAVIYILLLLVLAVWCDKQTANFLLSSFAGPLCCMAQYICYDFVRCCCSLCCSLILYSDFVFSSSSSSLFFFVHRLCLLILPLCKRNTETHEYVWSVTSYKKNWMSSILQLCVAVDISVFHYRRSVRISIASLVGTAAKHDLPNNAWPQLFEFLLTYTKSSDPTQCEVGVCVLSK